MTELHDATPEVRLRGVEDPDIELFFDHQADPRAAEMAGFPARDRTEMDAHWARLRGDDTKVVRTVVVGDEVAGNIGSWEADGQQLLGYFLGRAHWGRGVATRALALFMAEVPIRPLHAYVVEHNTGSIRVLEKCGFRRDEAQEETAAAEDGIRELVFVLDA